MIRHIYAHNNGINDVNSQVLGNMQQIDSLATTPTRISGYLSNLQGGLGEQDASLSNLNQF
ncbi:hypothetical protein [Effusibacillus dendaii]|uniref:hypothetical protein n=1 Tax=Effusibacillus dendaii TaxID=2743772 RepID=UPI00190C1779|nr:hypothetical protein [Effusibacillus dendaii]